MPKGMRVQVPPRALSTQVNSPGNKDIFCQNYGIFNQKVFSNRSQDQALAGPPGSQSFTENAFSTDQ
jgi:hypothetical protein